MTKNQDLPSYKLASEPTGHVWLNGREYAPVEEIDLAERVGYEKGIEEVIEKVKQYKEPTTPGFMIGYKGPMGLQKWAIPFEELEVLLTKLRN